jgi:uncharacterized membrane protein YraQ (UPF0718 family)
MPPWRVTPAAGIALFLLIAVAGLCYVKWLPYYGRAFVAATNHSIGHSILMGDAARPPAASFQAALDYALAYGKAIWQAMVLGLLVGSAIEELLPRAWIRRVLGHRGFGGVVAGGLLSLPGMMCTCCAAPVVIGLRRSEASPGAAVAFWLGNTVLNPATLVFMGFVLGWHWSLLRVLLGVPLVFGTGYLVNRYARPGDVAPLVAGLRRLPSAAERDLESLDGPSLERWLVRLGRLAIRLIPEYLVLVLLLGAARTWLFPQIGPAIGNDLQWIVLMAGAGLLFVIPTAGEVPIIQAMLALGMGSGPAGALLMTLAPVSLPSLWMTHNVFSGRLLRLVIVCVFVVGVVGGLCAATFIA